MVVLNPLAETVVLTDAPRAGTTERCERCQLPMTRLSFLSLVAALLFTGLAAAQEHVSLPAQVAGPITASRNPNYFKDANGAILILNGSQTWNTL